MSPSFRIFLSQNIILGSQWNSGQKRLQQAQESQRAGEIEKIPGRTQSSKSCLLQAPLGFSEDAGAERPDRRGSASSPSWSRDSRDYSQTERNNPQVLAPGGFGQLPRAFLRGGCGGKRRWYSKGQLPRFGKSRYDYKRKFGPIHKSHGHSDRAGSEVSKPIMSAVGNNSAKYLVVSPIPQPKSENAAGIKTHWKLMVQVLEPPSDKILFIFSGETNPLLEHHIVFFGAVEHSEMPSPGESKRFTSH